MHTDNKEMGNIRINLLVKHLSLTSVDADGDTYMTCWDLDKSFHVGDWGRDRCKRNWSLPYIRLGMLRPSHEVYFLFVFIVIVSLMYSEGYNKFSAKVDIMG